MRANPTNRSVRRAVTMAAVLVAVLGALPATSFGSPGGGSPSRSHRLNQKVNSFRQQVIDTQRRLDALSNQESLLDEQYNFARYEVDQTTQRLLAAQEQTARYRAAANAARRELDLRARAAYEGGLSPLASLLGSNSLVELSDRATFLGELAVSDQQAAVRAQKSAQLFQWSASEFQRALSAKAAALAALGKKRTQLQQAVAAERIALASMQANLRKAVAQREAWQLHLAEVRARRIAAAKARAARIAAAKARAARIARQHRNATPPQNTSGHPVPLPSPNASQAQIAIAAARSQIGVPYIYAAATPGVGFDCSGLTMWAWGQAGVSMAHVAAIQYQEFPHVPSNALQPGDLVFFYSPIHHVGLYVGNGMMIDAPHTGAFVEEVPVYWSVYVGAARP